MRSTMISNMPTDPSSSGLRVGFQPGDTSPLPINRQHSDHLVGGVMGIVLDELRAGEQGVTPHHVSGPGIESLQASASYS